VRLLQLTAESPSLSKLREKVQKGNFLAFIDALISINMKIITKIYRKIRQARWTSARNYPSPRKWEHSRNSGTTSVSAFLGLHCFIQVVSDA
jgi:hypothetical protein